MKQNLPKLVKNGTSYMRLSDLDEEEAKAMKAYLEVYLMPVIEGEKVGNCYYYSDYLYWLAERRIRNGNELILGVEMARVVIKHFLKNQDRYT